MAPTLTELELIVLGRELAAELSLGEMGEIEDQELEELGLELEQELAGLDVESLVVSPMAQQ